jgi:hypothetical protein
VIPAYNAESTIRKAVESALRQTCPPLEVIVADDCSTDETWRVLDGIKDSRLRVVRLPTNSGSGAARNAAIQSAEGDVIACLDADDTAHLSRLEVQLPAFEGSPGVVLVYGSARVMDEAAGTKAVLRGCKDPGAFAWAVRFRNPVVTSTATFRKESFLLAGNRHANMRVSEDHALWLDLAKRGQSLAVKQIVAVHSTRPNGLTATHGAEMERESISVAIDSIAELTGCRPSEPSYRVLRYGAAPGVEPAPVLDEATVVWCAVFDAVQSGLATRAQRHAAAQESLNELRRLLRAWPDRRFQVLRQVVGLRRLGLAGAVPSAALLKLVRTLIGEGS